MGDWKAPTNQPDPVAQIMLSHEGRVAWRIPIRLGRMVASPYGFLRGTAVVMGTAPLHDGARLRHVRMVRDYGMFDRSEAPEYYPDAIRSHTERPR